MTLPEDTTPDQSGSDGTTDLAVTAEQGLAVQESTESSWDADAVELDDALGSPAALAIVAALLAGASLLGLGLMNGGLYVAALVSPETGITKGLVVAAGLLGATFALLPVFIGLRASGRALPGDPHWVTALARAAVMVGLLSLVLRLFRVILVAGQPVEQLRNGFGFGL